MRALVLITALALALSGCATAQRFDAANDVHALLVSIRDNDPEAFEAHVDRAALERQIEARISQEATKRSGKEDWAAAVALLAPTIASLAGDALIQPKVFLKVAEYYGYKASTPVPASAAIAGSLRTLDTGQVCAAEKKDGPCILIFTRYEGTWRLSSFAGDLSMLRTRGR